MKESITINSKEYKVPTFDFGAICDLESLGINFVDVESKSFNFIRGLVALTIGCGIEKANKEINEHLMNGGAIDDFIPLLEAVTKSDFFQQLTKKRKK